MAFLGLTACNYSQINVSYDVPFVFIQDGGGSANLTVDAEANNYTTTLYVGLSCRKMDHNVTVDYKITVGDGLTEGVDFRLKDGLEGKITFNSGVYRQPIHIIWYNHGGPMDTSKDNTLRVDLVNCSESDFTIGYPNIDGNPVKIYSSFTFTRK